MMWRKMVFANGQSGTRTPCHTMTSVCGAAILVCLASASGFAQDTQPNTLTETYGAWAVSCRSVDEAASQPGRECQLSQNLQRQGDGQRVMFVGLTRNPDDGGTTLTAIAPFGLDLSEGFAIEVEENIILQAPFSTCLPAGCVVNAAISMEQIRQMSSHDIASGWMVANGQTAENPLRIQFSMNGFLNGWNRLVDLSGG